MHMQNVSLTELARDQRGAGPQDQRTGRTHASANVLGVSVSALDLPEAVQLVADAIENDDRGYICVCGVHGLIECRGDAQLRDIHNTAMAVTPDGMPLVWALHGAGHDRAGRVYGPDLMLGVFEEGVRTGMRHFLYGTTPAALADLEASLLQRFPGARIVGVYAPPFRPLTEAEEYETAALINASGADVVWVGLSTPKQERWMAHMRPKLNAPVLLGVGAAFDFIGGKKPSAPAILQRNGFEWLFRLVSEPRRLWRRYARIVPTYLVLRLLQKTGLRQFPIPAGASRGFSGRDPS